MCECVPVKAKEPLANRVERRHRAYGRRSFQLEFGGKYETIVGAVGELIGWTI